MSPNINSFVGDLVEMARAMEELPGIKAAMQSQVEINSRQADTIASHELHILALKADIEAHLSTIRNLEVARDDAELRFLEADEKADRAATLARAMQTTLGSMIYELDPPKPQPEPVVQAQPVDPKPEPKAYVYCDDNEPFLSTADGKPESVDTAPTVAMSGDPTNVDSWASGPGQSEALPTTASTQTDEALQASATNSAIKSEDAGLQTKPSGRYSGRRYYDWATYVPLHQWLAEGGTEEDYNWRPVSSRIG